LLRLLQVDGGIKQLNIIAHSMGNLIVADALANQADKFFKPQVNELIMAAPDIDRDQFLQGAKDILSLARGVTLYASSQDKAIALSRTLAGAPRAGDVFGGKPVLAAGIQAIDASVLGAEMLGLNHSTFAERRALMNDIRLLLTQKIRPPNLRMTEIRPMPEGSEDAPEYWRFTD
jgi:esterase/lipase superfamily enzyme